MEEISYSGSRLQIKRRISKRVALFGIFFIIIVLLLGSVAYFVTRGNSQDQVTESITLPEESSPEITEEEASPTPEESPTPTKEEEEPTAAPTEAVSGAGSVAVQNGSGESGVAGAAAAVLRGAGFSIASTGNADNFDYTDVTIQVKNSKKSILSDLEDALSKDYTIGKTSTDLAESASYDALVIIGK